MDAGDGRAEAGNTGLDRPTEPHGEMTAVRRTDPLTERQLEVLCWVADGCPDGVMTGHTHKSSARALEGRRLLKISKPNGAWSATVTDIGSYYLAHGSFPPTNHKAYTAKHQRSPTPGKPASRERSDAGDRQDAASAAERPAKPRKVSPPEQLVADVLAAGGRLKEPRDTRGNGWSAVRELVRNANRYGKTPPGTRLAHKLVHEGEHWYGSSFDVFTLVEGPAGTDAPLLPVPVSDQVERYHPAVSARRKAKRLSVGSVAETRAHCILHAVAVEAEHRGFAVAPHLPKTTAGDASQSGLWHLLFTYCGETVPLRIEEETDRIEHVPTPDELKAHERRPWIPIPTHDHPRSGRLRIEIGGQSQLGRPAAWADRTRWRLDDKLPEVLREVAVRADELRLRREAKTRAEDEYRQAVDREEEQARARAAEAHRQEVLENQLVKWRAAQELRKYATAVADRIAVVEAGGQVDGKAVADAQSWLEWIQQRADRQDPTMALATWPKPPQLASYELRKFMKDVPESEEMRYRPDTYG